jgi:hypothetical protein
MFNRPPARPGFEPWLGHDAPAPSGLVAAGSAGQTVGRRRVLRRRFMICIMIADGRSDLPYFVKV